MPRLTPVVLNIILLNVMVMIAMFFFQNQPWVREYFALYKLDIFLFKTHFVPENVPAFEFYADFFKPVQVVTYMFTHGGIIHLLFNSLALASLGTQLEMVIGSKRFLSLYFFSGISAAVITVLLDPSPGPVVGASAAIFGLMAACVAYLPHTNMSMMFIPVQIPIRTFVMILGGISLVMVYIEFRGINIYSTSNVAGLNPRISHFGHFAGILGGFLYLQAEQMIMRKKN